MRVYDPLWEFILYEVPQLEFAGKKVTYFIFKTHCGIGAYLTYNYSFGSRSFLKRFVHSPELKSIELRRIVKAFEDDQYVFSTS